MTCYAANLNSRGKLGRLDHVDVIRFLVTAVLPANEGPYDGLVKPMAGRWAFRDRLFNSVSPSFW